ncbi:MAG: c-type cytochrome [Bacteroidia bacterium]
MNKNNVVLGLAMMASVGVMVACGGGEQKAEEKTAVVEETAPVEDVWTAPEEAKSVTNPFEANEASLEIGKNVFAQYCVSCHGEDGKAEVPAGQAVKAANLTVSTVDQTDGELHWKLLSGKGAMLKISTYGISDEDGWHLINYIRTMAQG